MNKLLSIYRHLIRIDKHICVIQYILEDKTGTQIHTFDVKQQPQLTVSRYTVFAFSSRRLQGAVTHTCKGQYECSLPLYPRILNKQVAAVTSVVDEISDILRRQRLEA